MPEDHLLVERDEVSVMFKRVADEPEAISSGMAEVEGVVGLRGRKYYGAFDADGSEYGIEFYRSRTVIDLLLPIS